MRGKAIVRIRPYKPLDAKDMTEWINNEKDFAKWCVNLIKYPTNYENLLLKFYY